MHHPPCNIREAWLEFKDDIQELSQKSRSFKAKLLNFSSPRLQIKVIISYKTIPVPILAPKQVSLAVVSNDIISLPITSTKSRVSCVGLPRNNISAHTSNKTSMPCGVLSRSYISAHTSTKSSVPCVGLSRNSISAYTSTKTRVACSGV